MYLGDFAEDATVYITFTTNNGSGGAVAPSSAFEAADVAIFKNGSATEKTSTNGITMTSPFNATTGLHLLAIDTSNNTGDVGFWVSGADYSVVLTPDETVDGQTVVSEIGSFSIENRLLSAARPEPGQGTPAVNASLMVKIDNLYKQWRNKTTNDGTETILYNDDGTTEGQKMTTSSLGGTVTVSEVVTGT